MKLKDVRSIALVCSIILAVIGGVILVRNESLRTQTINRDYIENSGLVIIQGRVYNRGWDSVYLDVYVYKISDYVELAIELNIKTLYLREKMLTFVADDTIYTTNLGLRDPSIDQGKEES